MKKKKTFKTPNSVHTNESNAEELRRILCDIREGRSLALRNENNLYNVLVRALNQIDKEKEVAVQLELLARLLNTDAVLNDVKNYDSFFDLYNDAADFFIEIAADFSDKEFLANIVHDLTIRHSGEDGRAIIFFSLEEFLPKERALKLLHEILETVESQNLENENFILEALRDMADGLDDCIMYERLAFLMDQDRSNNSLIDVANNYLSHEKISDAKRLLNEIRNPNDEETEDVLDLETAIAQKEGRTSDALQKANELYERFPTEINLGKYCSLLSATERRALLKEHIQYRMGNSLSLGFLQILSAYKEFELFEQELNHFGNESLTIMDAESLKNIAQEIEENGALALAARIRDWIVEEPEDLRDDEDSF